MPDRYVIQPSFSFWRGPNNSFSDITPVPEEFQYTSDTNKRWLDAAALRKLLEADATAEANATDQRVPAAHP